MSTNDHIQELLDEYDDLTGDVEASNHSIYESNLRRWFYYIETDAELSSVVSPLMNQVGLVSFKNWYDTGKKTVGGMVGSGNLNWPTDKNERLGLQIWLFKCFADDLISVVDFSTSFMYAGTRYDDMVALVNEQLFRPMARDLRRLFVQRFARPSPLRPTTIAPAADRIVSLDHNSDPYRKAVAALREAIDAVRSDNEYAERAPLDRAQRIAELRAGARLLEAPQVRVSAVQAVLVAALTWLSIQLAESTVRVLVTRALEWLAKLVDIDLGR